MSESEPGTSGFQIVVAADRNGGIGKNGSMPWKIPADMNYFRELTSRTGDASSRQNVVIMGRKTWESLPAVHRPLKGRINIVLSRGADDTENNGGIAGNGGSDRRGNSIAELEKTPNVYTAGSLEAALDLVETKDLRSRVETVFVIGGGQVYSDAINHPRCAAIHITRIQKEFGCDTFFPAIDSSKFKVWSASQPMQAEDGTKFTFLCYTVAGSSGTQLSLPPAMASRHDELQVC
jgi:dihydrofolate reductase/thymidylate synthase